MPAPPRMAVRRGKAKKKPGPAAGLLSCRVNHSMMMASAGQSSVASLTAFSRLAGTSALIT